MEESSIFKAGECELRDDFAQDFLHLLVPAAEE